MLNYHCNTGPIHVQYVCETDLEASRCNYSYISWDSISKLDIYYISYHQFLYSNTIPLSFPEYNTFLCMYIKYERCVICAAYSISSIHVWLYMHVVLL